MGIVHRISSIFNDDKYIAKLGISQKRSMLENVILTDTMEVHKQCLAEAGFGHAEVWFRCFNFGSWIAIKPESEQ